MAVPIDMQKLVLYRASTKHKVPVDKLQRHVLHQTTAASQTSVVDVLRAMSEPGYAKTSFKMHVYSKPTDVWALNVQQVLKTNKRSVDRMSHLQKKFKQYDLDKTRCVENWESPASHYFYIEIADTFCTLAYNVRALKRQLDSVRLKDPAKATTMQELDSNDDFAQIAQDVRTQSVLRENIAELQKKCEVLHNESFESAYEFLFDDADADTFSTLVDFYLMFDANKKHSKRAAPEKMVNTILADQNQFQPFPLLKKCLTRLISDSSGTAGAAATCTGVDARIFEAPCVARSNLFKCSKHGSCKPYKAVQPQTLSFFLNNLQLYTASELARIKETLKQEQILLKKCTVGKKPQWSYILLVSALSEAVKCSAAALLI